MFTGLIQFQGQIEDAVPAGAGHGRLVVSIPGVPPERCEPGASIAINGCCLTVVTVDDGESVTFDAMATTLEHTNLGALQRGDAVNVECALRMGDPLGGHWLQGHVDGVGQIATVEEGEGQLDVWLDVPVAIHRHSVERGSIAVDGVSLTVMGLRTGQVLVSLIPETRERTTLGGMEPGRPVNLEADILAKYVARLLPQAVDAPRDPASR